MAMIDEAARLDALRQLDLLDTAPSESFDRITRMASRIFNLPIAAVSLTDTDRQWFKSRVGVDHMSIPREKAPCAQVAETCGVLVIEDLLEHPCYRDSVLASSGVRFYAGAPLTTSDGYGLGAMCVLGTEPRTTTNSELTALKDLAAMVMAQIELQHAFGRIDPISGFPNRTQFIEDLDDLGRDQAGHRRIVALADLVPLEQLNHATRVKGSGAIDDMVKEAARNLRAFLASEDKAYQVGATQFAWLAPCEFDEFRYMGLMLERSEQLRHLGGSRPLGAPAIGVAPFTLGELPISDVLRIAQGAAQDARASGRLVSLHSTKQDSAFQRSYRLLRDFEAAIQAPEDLRLFYQPRIDLATGRCVGAEALLRWAHPHLGAIPPAEFIPLIEKTALATPTTAWVIDTAARQLALWLKAGIRLQVSVNISAANLRDDGFATDVKRILAQHRLPASALELEVTETAVMDDAEQALAQLQELSGAGIRLAIDDFGTGYSSLSYLHRLPVRVVKIDRSFIKDVDTDPRQFSLITMMATMSKHLGHRVVAEGVETAQVLEQLRATACDEVQGYFFARPMPADDFVGWLTLHDHGTQRAQSRRKRERKGVSHPATGAA